MTARYGNYTNLITYLQNFRDVSDSDAAIICSFFEPKDFKEGEYLFGGHKVCTELFFITSGIVRIVTVNEKGAEVTHYFYKENQFCCILKSFMEQIPLEPAIQASCDASALVTTRRKLDALCEALPYMKELMDRFFRQQLIDKVETRNSYLGEDAETQYKLFIRLHGDIALRIPLKDIASYLGITPQSLSRIRKNIVTHGS